jgi:hypothetical protein
LSLDSNATVGAVVTTVRSQPVPSIDSTGHAGMDFHSGRDEFRSRSKERDSREDTANNKVI